jgi:hypothetical protein
MAGKPSNMVRALALSYFGVMLALFYSYAVIVLPVVAICLCDRTLKFELAHWIFTAAQLPQFDKLMSAKGGTVSNSGSEGADMLPSNNTPSAKAGARRSARQTAPNGEGKTKKRKERKDDAAPNRYEGFDTTCMLLHSSCCASCCASNGGSNDFVICS